MRRVWWQSDRRDCGSEVSAARIETGGGGSGRVAQFRVWVSFDGFRPAIAMELNLRDDEEVLVVLRNLRDSLRTCLPVKPDAPRIMTSNAVVGAAFNAITIHYYTLASHFKFNDVCYY